MPLLSVIIPVFNVAPFLNECLASVSSQEFPDIEILCIDDGSTDDSPRILDAWAKKDFRIRVIHQENHGLSSARNQGIRLACGEYLTFVDSDDVVRHNIYTTTIPLMLANQLDALIYSFETFPEGKIFTTGFPTNEVVGYQFLFSSNAFIQTDNLLCFSWRFLFKTSILTDNDLQFDERIKIGEDMVFNIDVLCHSKRIMVIDTPLYLYRKDNADSIMSRRFKPDLEYSYTRMYTKKLAQIQEYGLQDSAYPFDLARYTVLCYLRLFIQNVYHSPNQIDRKSEIMRIHSLKMFNDAFHRIGFRNIGLTRKEYLFYLAQKFHFWMIILPRYERMFQQ